MNATILELTDRTERSSPNGELVEGETVLGRVSYSLREWKTPDRLGEVEGILSGDIDFRGLAKRNAELTLLYGGGGMCDCSLVEATKGSAKSKLRTRVPPEPQDPADSLD